MSILATAAPKSARVPSGPESRSLGNYANISMRAPLGGVGKGSIYHS